MASFEKTIVDAEMLQGMFETMAPIAVNDAEIGIEAMAEVGPGGHFFGAAHTLERYETAFYAPMLSDWRNWETWVEGGKPRRRDAGQRDLETAAGDVRGTAARSRDPRGAWRAFVARRKAEGGARDT